MWILPLNVFEKHLVHRIFCQVLCYAFRRCYCYASTYVFYTLLAHQSEAWLPCRKVSSMLPYNCRICLRQILLAFFSLMVSLALFYTAPSSAHNTNFLSVAEKLNKLLEFSRQQPTLPEQICFCCQLQSACTPNDPLLVCIFRHNGYAP